MSTIINMGFEDAEIAFAIADLPEGQAAVLALVFAGFQQQHIVSLLGISRTTVWAHKRAALHALAGQLSSQSICS